ncbi:MtrAB system histidine kinase MtrB [Nocardioides sp.]|uniref:MtrAB system histidine kinase MtrB n=1 Tax=Nocardioides sp. TaxID=35761 RepID=UPI00262BF62A|nr:MtrAB system histidine kinase MtrB [Nocardioides sp.]
MYPGWGSFWRRSLQARVVISTVLLSLLACSIMGWFLVSRVREGLLHHRVSAVVAETATEIDDAKDRLSAASTIDRDSAGQQRDLIEPMIQRGATRGYQVVMAGPLAEGGGRIADGGAEFSPGLETASVPRSLEDHFLAGDTSTAWTYTTIRSSTGEGTTRIPGVVVGSLVTLPADGKSYVLYFLYPMSDEADTLALVNRALLAAGALLLLFMAASAWLVARHVVTPIRMARQVAERITDGQLQERLVVHGEDDLARLALSFNQMADALQRQIRQLEDLSRLQRRFTSDVSHELRTPLTTVRMATDLLHDSRDTFDPASARAAELLQTELDRFERLLTDLLEISRFDAGAAALETEDVDLVELSRQVVEAARPLAAKRGLEIRVIAPPTPCLAEADARRVERILRNLVTNAIDHAAPPGEHPGGDVLVQVASDDAGTAVSVRDFGVGLAPGESAMVFNRFWRADPARARTSGGTGLGLAIALEDATLHGGWLQAWGQPGHGAVFRLTLPRRTGSVLRHSPLPLIPAGAGTSTRGRR